MPSKEAMGIPHTREPWWKFTLARLLGEKMLGVDHITETGEGVIQEGYLWRGSLYIIKYHVALDPEKKK